MSNGTTDYKLGEITAELKDMNRRFSKNDTDHKEMFDSISDLNAWRWKVVGASAIVGSIVTFIGSLFVKVFI